MEEKTVSGDHQEFTRLILRYLVEHPDAKDTIEGILTFWVKQQDVQAKKQVQLALDDLVKQGWVFKRELTSDKNFYGINKQALGDVTTFLTSP